MKTQCSLPRNFDYLSSNVVEILGLRDAMILTGCLMVIGSVARCIPFKATAFTWSCHLCAILNGAAGVVVFSAPSAVSAAWFPPQERATATGIAIVFNNMGNALSFLMGPAIVPDPVENADNQTSFLTGPAFLAIEHNNGSQEPCLVLPSDEMLLIKERINDLMYFGKSSEILT